MKTQIYSIKGEQVKSMDLPKVFKTGYNPALIRRAVVTEQSTRLQPKGNDITAGLKTSAEYIGRRQAFRSGINKGISRLPRVKLGGGGLGEVRIVPHAKGGRRAHPPKVEKVLEKHMNKKEKKLALMSAIAATTQKELVKERGHELNGIKDVPIIVEDKFQSLKKTKEAVETLTKLGLGKDLNRASKKKVRAGKKRVAKHEKKKSVLIIVGKDDGAIKACRNIQGVDIATVERLNVGLLAPGAHAGRLTVWTESAVKQVGEKYGA
ncbi:MAG: 50S ribosomal protein L4 [Candidatus Diapherotrites archaeon]|nr:50S ribosomal protein L4 [Candidatus Diapherotrites archaeon]